MREQFGLSANRLLAEDPRTAVLLADISLGLFADALEAEPRRVVNVGIMEQALIGVAAGFAMEGFRPIATTIAPFLVERPLEQIKLDLGLQGLPATLVSNGASYDYATEGTTHHAPGDVQALLSIPGVEVHVPGAGPEVDVLLRHAHGRDAVSYLRTSEAANGTARDVRPGRLEVVRRGGPAAPVVIAVGPMLDRTLAATGDRDATVLYATTIAPFAAGTLRGLVPPAGLVVAVEPFHEGTLAFTLTEALRDRPTRIVEIGVPRALVRGYGSREDLDASLGLDAAGLRRRLEPYLH
jgi:transketolase